MVFWVCFFCGFIVVMRENVLEAIDYEVFLVRQTV